MNITATPTLHNFTRRSDSIGRKLWRQRRFAMLIKYWLMRLSDLGREGVENSGSYRFADHIYRCEPSGRGALGKAIDRKLLSMPATQAFRRRYLRAQAAVRGQLAAHTDRPIKVLAVPCGIPRDISELAPDEQSRIDYTAVDLNPEVLAAARDHLDGTALHSVAFQKGDALNPDTFPTGEYDVVLCTGLGEFLDDAELATLYSNVHRTLAPGGVFYTSATDLEPKSEALLRAMELDTNYRDRAALERVFATSGIWPRLDFEVDETGLQTFVRATR